MSDARVVTRTPSLQVVGLDGVLISGWTGVAPTVEHIREAMTAVTRDARTQKQIGFVVIVIVRQSSRTFVQNCDFRTSVGFGDGPGSREALGLRGGGPELVITDLGILRPDPVTCELVQSDLHPGVTVDQARAATGWPLRFAPDVGVTGVPTPTELAALRELQAA